mmetsp:Transcript_23864/g.34904  ORF Transcript_23864/g.34904 Transcript_23864/m.34904 type:complete len:266 (-) Transcript_23864:238-1035(-)|eukprot:CAMPEP_0195511328 /NCGR_PEP_ID=MMETSP0794_2-20130614/3691_1 /TAXON_ID=515487 /ORGANISM="Stephanopyxis turris, Strain CCMP 815" /LENGTH=265 /DNA_ID=CAMNT_0040638903 /DNA_START=148 /DNA_END=945 /DNA_ORIENTATION=+
MRSTAAAQRENRQNPDDYEFSKLKQELSIAKAIANHQTTSANHLRMELARVQQENHALNVENDELANDILDIVDENRELKVLLKATLEKKRDMNKKFKALVRERHVLEEELEIKETELTNCEEVAELVMHMRQQVKCKLKQATSRQEELETDVQILMSEKAEMYEAIEMLMRDRADIEEQTYVNDIKRDFIRSYGAEPEMEVPDGSDDSNSCTEEEEDRLIMEVVSNIEGRKRVQGKLENQTKSPPRIEPVEQHFDSSSTGMKMQ